MYKIFHQASRFHKPFLHRPFPIQNTVAKDRMCCSLCRTKVLYDLLRCQHSSFVPTEFLAAREMALKKKRRTRKKKKYAELMEVTQGSSNVTKAVVKNLTANHVSMLADRPDVTLEHLHNLKKVEKTGDRTSISASSEKNQSDQPQLQKNRSEQLDRSFEKFLKETNFRILDDQSLEREACKELNSESTEKNIDMLPPSYMASLMQPFNGVGIQEISQSLEQTHENITEVKVQKRSHTVTEETIRKKNKERLNMLERLEWQRLEKNFNFSLSSYIDLCVNSGFLHRAFASLVYYHGKPKKRTRSFRLTNIVPFNTLMHGFACKGNLDKVKDIYDMIQSVGIKPTPQTFAACFECMAHIPQTEETMAQLSAFKTDLESKGYQLNDMFVKCTYTDSQKHYVLQAVKRLQPDFVPHIPPPTLCYSCDLLKQLNERNSENKPFRSPAEGLLTESYLRQMVKEQLSLELKCSVEVKSVAAPEKLTDEMTHCRKKWEELWEMWRMSVREALARDLEVQKKKHSLAKLYNKIGIYPYLRSVTAEQLVEVIMKEVRKLAEGSETYSPTTRQLWSDLGSQVRMRYQLKFKSSYGLHNKTERLYEDYCSWYLEPGKHKESKNSRHRWQMLMHNYERMGPSMEVKEKFWPPAIKLEIGRFLYNIIMRDIRIDVNALKTTECSPDFRPAFYTLYRLQAKTIREELKPHPVFMKLYRQAEVDTLEFDATMMPMMSPPLPWTSLYSGGYLVAKTDFIRTADGPSAKQWQKLDETSTQNLYPVFDSLNQLSSIPWTVNENVLDIILEVFKKGGSKKLKIPLHSSTFHLSEQEPSSSDQETDKLQAYRKRLSMSRKKAEMYGLWCEALYKLSLANHFRGRVFWLPHNIDFRGRVYPVPPHLNHLGSDMARSLLCFAKGEPLGPNGFDWLKVHCINLTGLKKRDSVAERLAFANSILPDIIDSAENPLTGKMWWAESDEPWQTLSCCIEIKKVLDSGDPENYVTKIPIHQDGSCNGLQHYAALGRDYAGACSVNLAPSDVPQDVYSCVVSLVEEEREKDAAAGKDVAIALEGFIKRKVIKQTIMTTVYGVTRYGARLQIAKQLKDIGDFPQHLVWSASLYLVQKTFFCLREMFTSTKEIQDWFVDCARNISQMCGQNVEWITPLGLLVVQPYTKMKKSALLCKADGSMSEHFPGNTVEYPNVMKQKNAFPPNFIHSLDSSHMMLTSLFCEREGITFVSVHDCFWTHPASVEVMNQICRKQFVALHSQPILEDLSAYFQKQFGSFDRVQRDEEDSNNLSIVKVAKNVPKKGEFVLESVLDSVYFFS